MPDQTGHGAEAAQSLPSLRLKRGEERRLRAGHLWIFSNEVDNAATPLARVPTGSLVRVQSDRQQTIGTAYCNPHALICARLLSRVPDEPIDAHWLEGRLRSALRLRERLYRAPYYRWVFGESDGLPGLVLDRFGDLLVGQLATAGMEALRPVLEQAIIACVAPRALIWKNDGSAREHEQLAKEVRIACGEAPTVLEVLEAGARFHVPLAAAQKTGWFYDQVWNRQQLLTLMPPRARVLDVCGYAGAWSVIALRAGAASATCVDASAAAIAMAEANARTNGVSITGVCADAFDALGALREQGERFDVVVLDPPAFIKRKRDLARGQAAYRKLNQLALGLLAEDGLLVSCSCSYHQPAESLLEAIQAGARHANRRVQVLLSGGQSPDHPVHPAIAETRYLKAFFCRVQHE